MNFFSVKLLVEAVCPDDGCEPAVECGCPKAAYIEYESRGERCIVEKEWGADGLIGKNDALGDVGGDVYAYEDMIMRCSGRGIDAARVSERVRNARQVAYAVTVHRGRQLCDEVRRL